MAAPPGLSKLRGRILADLAMVRRAFPAPRKGTRAVRELDETMAGDFVGSS